MLGQVSYCQNCCLNSPPRRTYAQEHTDTHTNIHTHSEASITVPVSQACDQYSPLTTCTHVMERKKGGEGEESKGKEGMLCVEQGEGAQIGWGEGGKCSPWGA